MKITAAMSLCRENVNGMTLEQLQRHRVRLLDAWRESTAQYGFSQAVADGFYVPVGSESATGYVPRHMWLSHNLNTAIDAAREREKFLLNAPE